MKTKVNKSKVKSNVTVKPGHKSSTHKSPPRVLDEALFLLQIARESLYAFVVQMFEATRGVALEQPNYVRYACERIEPHAQRCHGKLIINLPPRHLKTFMAVCCLATWLVGRDSTLRIFIVAGNEVLAAEIMSEIRTIMGSRVYSRIFAARLRKSQARTTAETTDGGTIRVVTLRQEFTGSGGDVVLVDDLAGIGDAGNDRLLAEINSLFDQKVRSRRNRGTESMMIMIMHRLAVNDLTGHLLSEGEWDHIMLPYEAEEDQLLHAGTFRWHRQKGDRLRANAYSAAELETFKNDDTPPGYDALYQQRPEGPMFEKFRATSFQTFYGALRDVPVVISVDPAQTVGPRSDFSVIQTWAHYQGVHILVDEVCARLESDELGNALAAACRRQRPSFLLIEANGPVALLKYKVRKLVRPEHVKEMLTGNKSKGARLAPYADFIRCGGVQLGVDLVDPDAFVAELTGFPDYPYDDRVDALTQYFRFFESVDGNIPPRGQSAIVSVRKYR